MAASHRTQVEMLIKALKSLDWHQGGHDRLASVLGWDPEKVRKVAAKAEVETTADVFSSKGGVVKYGGRDSKYLYEDVAAKICGPWGTKQMKIKGPIAIITPRTGLHDGVWTHPDVVVAANPQRRDYAGEPYRLHAIEVEAKAEFDLRSVYQAHAQGRGASYSWVFGSVVPGVTVAGWDRIELTAKELGVGLVTFERPTAATTWTIHCSAVRRHPSPAEREAFLDIALGPKLRAAHGL